MTEKIAPPERLSNNPTSPHFDFEAMQRGVGVRFKDRERSDIEEYCVSEGWVRVAAGKAVDRNGYPVTVKLSGPVEIWWRDESEGGSDIAPHQNDSARPGHSHAERSAGPGGHGSHAPPQQIRKKQDRSSGG
jgi:hypothetical protein